MLRWRRFCLLVAAAALLAAVPVGSGSEALAQSGDCYELRWVITGQDQNGNPTYGWGYVNVCDDPGGGGGGGAATACQHPNPVVGEVPCYHDVYGWWSRTYNCYVHLAPNQPSAGHQDWDGHDPDEGAIYVFYCPEVIGGQVAWSDRNEFLAQAPSVPSVADLAQQAMDSLPLVGADIGIAPDPDGVGLVGVYVWLWTNNADATWGPVTVRVPGPGITVVAEGEAVRIEWDMGDGTVETCTDPGEPYLPEYGAQEPECGHVYDYPSTPLATGRYEITATTVWDVRWWVEGSDEGGGEGFTRESSTSVEIHELQVVTS